MTAVPLKLDGQRVCFGVACVPLEVIEQSQDRPFAALVLDVKAVTQITGSFP